MKIILKEDVKNLGEVGAIKNVADGYARNYLFVNKLAMEASSSNMKILQLTKEKIARDNLKNRAILEKLKVKLSTVSVNIAQEAKNEEELYKLCHYTNLQPLCSKINREIKRENYEVSI